MTKQQEAVVEVPKDLVERKQSASKNENLREKVIGLDLARRAALGTFSTGADRVAALFDEDTPIWYENRPYVMNERAVRQRRKWHQGVEGRLGIKPDLGGRPAQAGGL